MSENATLPEIRWLETRISRWDDLVEFGSQNGMRVTPETAMKTGVYFACARIVAETVASCPLHLYRRLSDDASERAVDIPLYRVLARRPNSWQTRYEWVEQMCLHLAFYGAAYNLKVPGVRGSVTELHPLHAGFMERRASHEDPYIYREPGTGRQITYRPDQIMHVRWLSTDGINGEVPVELGKDAINLARSLEKYAATFYANNAQPGIILHTDQALPRETREQLREQWNQRHAGPGRAGQTAILSNGLKADTISATNQESQLAELWLQALLAVCRIWRMPPHMVQELGRATWGNLASEMVSFEKFTIQPWLRRIEGSIERDIIGEQEDLYAEFLVEGLLRSDITTRYQAYEVALRNGWMTVEEVRRRENLGPLPPSEDDSPGEVEDTPVDAAEDEMEGEDDTPDAGERSVRCNECGGKARAFCATGPGGGVDNSCSSKGGAGGKYREAKTREEAEEVGRQYAKSVNYRGVDLDMANRINQEIDAVFSQHHGMEPLKSITAKKFTGKGGQSEDAPASYHMLSHELTVNTAIIGSQKKWDAYEKRSKESEEIVAKALAEGRLNDRQRAVAELHASRGSLVDESLAGVVTHELGHHFDATILMKEPVAVRKALMDRREQYEPKLSAYASTNAFEYFAESYVAYRRGREIDPELKSHFDRHSTK